MTSPGEAAGSPLLKHNPDFHCKVFCRVSFQKQVWQEDPSPEGLPARLPPQEKPRTTATTGKLKGLSLPAHCQLTQGHWGADKFSAT
jgi:hypothetical protein